ncbi:MAG TPA: DUF1684 domain-containing protein [Myxococcales bacterium]|nr:DUF1684 domain-containing protein [Myxococcales bacterium]
MRRLVTFLPLVALRPALAQNLAPMDVEKLLAERAETLAAFKDPHKSPHAAIARRDFQGTPLVLGSGEDCDVQLEGTRPHHARVAVEGDRFHVEALDDGATVEVAGTQVRDARIGAGGTFGIGRFVIRLSHQNFPALLVLDPQSPRLKDGPPPRWFPPDPAFRIAARLERDPGAREEIVLSTRGNPRRARRLGRFSFELGGRKHQLTALRLLEPGVDEAALSVFFRDATTGRESYPVGRYLEPQPVPGDPDRFILDFNRAYNPTCAFSPFYNCPIPPRENILQLPIRAGEMDPGGH